MKETCKNCKHWKNKQMLLNYNEDIGFCVSPKLEFNTVDGRPVGVVDVQNLKDRVKVSGNSSHAFEHLSGYINVTPSRYLLTTSECFGCNMFQK